MKWFPDTTYWRVLKPKNETVDEPNNTTFKNHRASTITEEDAKCRNLLSIDSRLNRIDVSTNIFPPNPEQGYRTSRVTN